MKYALLVYESAHGSWQNLSTEQQRAIHAEYRALAASPGVTGLYRLRPPVMTTVRVEEEQIVQTEVRLTDTQEQLRAFYLLENDDHGAVDELDARIPAARTGGTVQIWPRSPSSSLTDRRSPAPAVEPLPVGESLYEFWSDLLPCPATEDGALPVVELRGQGSIALMDVVSPSWSRADEWLRAGAQPYLGARTRSPATR